MYPMVPTSIIPIKNDDLLRWLHANIGRMTFSFEDDNTIDTHVVGRFLGYLDHSVTNVLTEVLRHKKLAVYLTAEGSIIGFVCHSNDGMRIVNGYYALRPAPFYRLPLHVITQMMGGFTMYVCASHIEAMSLTTNLCLVNKEGYLVERSSIGPK